jgi:hypothetical protein
VLAAVPVCRSIVVRAANSVQALRASLGATRAVNVTCAHSQRALVSNDTQFTQLWTSVPHLLHRLSAATGTASR